MILARMQISTIQIGFIHHTGGISVMLISMTVSELRSH